MTTAKALFKRLICDRKTHLSVAILFTSVLAVYADDLYVNDFATRTSEGPIPAIGIRQEAQPYPASKSYLRYWVKGSEAPYTTSAPLSAFYLGEAESGYGRPNVDGWYTPNIGPYTFAPYYWDQFDGSLADNPVFTWAYNSDTSTAGATLHSIHNELTNGLLRVQVDIKSPVRWNAKNGRIRFSPVYRKCMEIPVWDGKSDESQDDCGPGRIGVRGTTGNTAADLVRSFPFWANTSAASGTQLGNNDSGNFTDDGSNGKTNYWFRFVVTYDLDNNTFGGEVYRFSKAKGHPSFDTEPSDAAPYQSFANAPARKALSDETGGIAGLCIGAGGSFRGTTSAYANGKPFLDNIRLSWKAPGATDFEVFYENDFSNRWYKTLCAPATTTGSYSQSTEAVSETDTYTYPSFSGNLDKRMLIPGAINGTSASQPVGLDGWKKLPYRNHSGGGGHAAVHAYGGTTYDAGGVGTNMLTYGDQGNFSTMGQTLGKVFTTGKVKISVDARLPEGGKLTQDIERRRMAVGLGSLALYDTAATSADACVQIAAGFGYHRINNTGICSSKPYTLATYISGDEPNRNYPGSYVAPETNAWYRMVVDADLDARTYDVSMTPLGTASVLPDYVPVASPIFTATDLPFAANVADIGSFYLYGYGQGADTAADKINSRVCFDNIRVWHDSDLIYENDFKTRTRALTGATREAGDLAALQYNLDGGQDHWVRRDYTGPAGFDARAWVRDDNGNKFLSLGRSAEAGRTITLGNSLGCSVRKNFRFEVDIRPPSQWSDASGAATISLGDSQMAQTEAPESVYGAHRLVTFGFNGTNAQSSASCPFYFAGCKAQVGGTELDAAIDPTHWYRFRLKVNTQQGSYDVELRDMGTEHPTAETRGGTVVATAEDVAFENPLASGEGVSTILIEGKNVSGSYGSLGVDPAHVLIDNIKMSDIPGMIVICF